MEWRSRTPCDLVPMRACLNEFICPPVTTHHCFHSLPVVTPCRRSINVTSTVPALVDSMEPDWFRISTISVVLLGVLVFIGKYLLTGGRSLGVLGLKSSQEFSF